MSMEKIATTSEKDLITLDTSEMNKDKLSGRVDINHLMARVRVKEQKENKINIIFFGLIIALVVVVGTILSF